MEEINCVLLTEGPSDVALKPIVLWVVQQYHQASLVECEWADWRRFPLKSRDIVDKIRAAVKFYCPCHILFIHRDADSQCKAPRGSCLGDALAHAADSQVPGMPWLLRRFPRELPDEIIGLLPYRVNAAQLRPQGSPKPCLALTLHEKARIRRPMNDARTRPVNIQCGIIATS
jgi:hypothetical protein